MNTSILKTDSNSISLLIGRGLLAIVIFPHGAQKLLGVFEGYGFEGTMNYFTQTVGLPWIIGFLVILAESFGTILLFVGFLSRIAASAILVSMVGAAAVNFSNGFFMNWFGNQAGEGIEYFILAIGLAIPVILEGGGRWSVDGWLQKSLYINSRADKKAGYETSTKAV